ncbi:MAG: hypothetical protein U5L01_06165 [Rheinheimera sp.]|nr:hypothetical protein [Rheinheimera sp.]
MTPTADGYQIHLNASSSNSADALRVIQKAGRTLDGLGLAQVQL